MNQTKLRLEWWDAKTLKPNPQNFRRHPFAQEASVRDVIDDVGWAGTVLFNERTGRLVDGNLRAKIARKGERVPVLIGSWSEADERKILATFDALGAMAIADKAALESLLADVKFESSAVVSMLEELVTKSDLGIKLGSDLDEPPDHVEHADQLQKKWKTLAGQSWKISEHILACGDSSDPVVVTRALTDGDLKQLIDLIWTDSPFGADYAGKTRWMAKHGAQRRRAPIANDALPPDEIRALFTNSLKIAANLSRAGASVYAVVPSGSLLPYFIAGLNDSGFTFKHSLIWAKNSPVLGRSDYNYKHETILYGWLENGAHYFTSDRTQCSVLEFDRPAASPFHPTTKPIKLVAQMILNSSRKGDLIYDPFCGSGTTILAGEQLGRKVLALELSPAYVAVSLERLSALGLRPKLIN